MIAKLTQFIRRWLRILLVLLLIAIVAGVYLFWRSTIPPAPSAFYTPPDVLPQGAPGTIIRSEPITENVPEGAVAWRILYLTTGLDGEPVAVSGTVAAPAGESAAPRPVIAFAQGTIGILPECGLSHRARPFGGIPQIDLMIQQGYVVAATDYPGLGTPGIHPYLVAPIEAHSVLDSVRAARQMPVSAGEEFVVWGRSQGGHSSLWTAILASDYAPELTLIAAAATAPAIDLEGILRFGETRRAGAILTAMAIYAWNTVYDEVDLDTLIRPEMREKFEQVARTCISNPAAFLLLGDIPTPQEFLALDLLTTEPYRSLIAESTPNGAISVPLLLTHGTGDVIIPFEGSVEAAAQRCERGEDVTLIRLPGVAHDAAPEAAVMTIGWFDDRFAGLPTGSTCPR
jgi:alpha-beta hydrolase superfamily lysophospholipase